MKTKTISVRLPIEEAKALEDMAKALEVSKSWLSEN